MPALAPRQQMLAKVHIAKKQLGLDDDTYRATLRMITGKASAGDCNDAELGRVIKHFGAKGFIPKRTTNRYLAKVQALWISGWNLGVVRDRRDEAMDSFIRRQTGIDSSRWLINAADAAKVIEALKQWLAREGKVNWSPIEPGMASYCDLPAHRIAVAQWMRLIELGNVTLGTTWSGNPKRPTEGLYDYGLKVVGKNLGEWTAEDWTKINWALGKRVRAVLAAKDGAP